MFTENEILVLKSIVDFCKDNEINRSKLARQIGVSPTTVNNILIKFSNCDSQFKGVKK